MNDNFVIDARHQTCMLLATCVLRGERSSFNGKATLCPSELRLDLITLPGGFKQRPYFEESALTNMFRLIPDYTHWHPQRTAPENH